MGNIVTRRRPTKSSTEDIQALMNQEDFLAEISERLYLEMQASGFNEKDLALALSKDESYVAGVVNGFANITVRELADVFTVFKKLISLNLVGVRQRKAKANEFVSIDVPCRRPREFDRVTMIFEKKESRFEAQVNFVVFDELKSSVRNRHITSLPSQETSLTFSPSFFSGVLDESKSFFAEKEKA